MQRIKGLEKIDRKLIYKGMLYEIVSNYADADIEKQIEILSELVGDLHGEWEVQTSRAIDYAAGKENV